MSLIDTYLNLCTEVYDLSKPTAPKDAYDFYRSYAIDAQGRILEPMCGTGRFLLPFVSEGFDVHGFDGSQHMLDALYRKAKDQNLNVNVWQGLVENLKIEEKYKLIFIPSGSFSLITDIEEIKNALKKFHNILTDDGVLVFEVETSKSIPTQTEIEYMKLRLYDDGNQLLNLLNEIGFSNIKTLKAFDRSKQAALDDEVIIYECKK